MMLANAYRAGCKIATDALGVTEPTEDDNSYGLARAVAMGGIGALPLLGMVGKRPLRNYEKGPNFSSLDDLAAAVRPGDILLTGDMGLSIPKGVISTFQGAPQGYHLSTVTRDGKLLDSHGSTGVVLKDVADYVKRKGRNVQVLRPRISDADMASYFDNLDNYARTSDALEQAGGKDARRKMFATGAGAVEATKELFLPSTHAPSHQIAQEQKSLFDGFELLKSRLAGGDKCFDGAGVGVCSHFPAYAMPGGIDTGKLPSQTLPNDYLRSTKLTPVGRYAVPSKWDKVLRAGPHALRLGLGAGLAAGIYKLTAPDAATE